MNLKLMLLTFILLGSRALALPDFPGPRSDDRASHQSIKETVHAKNLNVGVPDIEDVSLAEDEMLIRFYIGFGLQTSMPARQSHPLTLRELRVSDAGGLLLLHYPPCSHYAESSLGNPENAWRTIQEQDLFTVRDSRSYSDYPMVQDGTAFFIQIRTTDAYREFFISNPGEYLRGDNPRFLQIMEAVAAEFAQPAACYNPLWTPPDQAP